VFKWGGENVKNYSEKLRKKTNQIKTCKYGIFLFRDMFQRMRCGLKCKRREAKGEENFKRRFCARNVSASIVLDLLTKKGSEAVAGDMIKELLKKKDYTKYVTEDLT
jgi:hypothetical protein